MKLLPIINRIKAECPSFNSRVAAFADLSIVNEGRFPTPAAFVVPQSDQANENTSMNGYRQNLKESFVVIVSLDPQSREGTASVEAMHDIRAELWRALLTWQPSEGHGGIEYEGGELLDFNAAQFFYQYEFSAETQIIESDTARPAEEAALSDFTTAHVDMKPNDAKDPVGADIPLPQ